MLRWTGFAVLFAVCSACELGGKWAEPPPQEAVAAPVFFVRQPAPEVSAATPALVLLAPPSAPADGSELRPFASLRSALQLAPAGSILRVEEGIWREKLEIARPVVIVGRGAGKTRLVAPDGTLVTIEIRSAPVQLQGLSIEGGQLGVSIAGGAGHKLENVELRGMSEGALQAHGSEISMTSVWVSAIGDGIKGKGIEIFDGSLDGRHLAMDRAGRRAIVLQGSRGVLEDLEVSGSAVGAVQAIDLSDVRIVRGEFERQGGAALYSGGSKLTVDGAHLRHDEYGIIGARGSELRITNCEVSDYKVAGVALVKSHGSVQGTAIARGGTESGISISFSDGKDPVLLVDNRIQDPGTMGVHVTESTVTARGNTITSARLDRERDMGDGVYAVDSRLVLEDNVMRGNAGSGAATVRTKVQVDHNGFIGNGRAGVLMLDRSSGSATGNLFQRNAFAAVELGERAHATLARNRFEGNLRLDIDTGCGKGLSGTADLESGNTFAAPVRQRVCAE